MRDADQHGDCDVELTYAELADRVEALAGRLRQHGIGPGDVVAVMLPNRAELVLTILAAWRLGATATPRRLPHDISATRWW